MAESGRAILAGEGRTAYVLPALAYAPAPFADGFAGTLSIRPETQRLLLLDLAAALARRGVALLALVNSHFDPAQVATLRETHGIYMTDAARINVAGLREADVPRFVEALKAVA